MEENQNVENQQQETTQGNEQNNVTLPQTQEELNLLIQREADRRVSSALKKNEEKLAAKYGEIIESEKQEAIRLAKLSKSERDAEEFRKEKEKLDSERKQIKSQKAEIQRKEVKMEIVKQLAEKGLPTFIAESLMIGDAEQISENIKMFEETWQQEIQKAVQGRLTKSKVPGVKTVENTGITKEQFLKMSYKERSELYIKDKTLYDSLIK